MKLSDAQVKALKNLARNKRVECGTAELRRPTCRVLREKGLVEVESSQRSKPVSYLDHFSNTWQSKTQAGYVMYKITEEGRKELARRGDTQNDWFEKAISRAEELEESWAPRSADEAALYREEIEELKALQSRVEEAASKS